MNSSNLSADKTPFTLTTRALTQLSVLSQNKGSNHHLLISLYNGGCQGISYNMELVEADSLLEGFRTHEVAGMTVRYKDYDFALLEGLEIDYSDHLVQGGFKFRNPNAKSTCGCGKSFGV